MKSSVRKFRLASFGALALSLWASSFAQTTGKNVVTVRGQKQEIYYYPATGAKLNRKVLFAPGDGGWRGWAITIAQQMAGWGYDVYGLDTKTYLSGFTGGAGIKESDVMSDFRQIAQWMTRGAGERVTLVGWSEGAGLGVWLAAGIGLTAVFAPLPKDLIRAADALGAGVILAAGALCYIVLRPPKANRFGAEPLRFVSSLLAKLSGRLQGMARTREFYLSLAGSLLLLAFQAMAFWLVMLGCGLRLSFWIGVAVFLIVRLGTAIPGAPANLGSYQFFTVLGLRLFGVDKNAATGFSLVVFALLTLPLLVLGFVAMSASGTSLLKIRREVQSLAGAAREAVAQR